MDSFTHSSLSVRFLASNWLILSLVLLSRSHWHFRKKNITLQDALSAVDAARAYYGRLRSDEEFDRFFSTAVSVANEHKISGPELPRCRRRPSRIEDGSMPHQYPNPKAFYRHIYYEACDLLLSELEHRFQNQHIPSVLAIEQMLLKAANGSSYQNELSAVEVSCYKNDIDWADLSRHLPLLRDVVKKSNPILQNMTSIHSIICEALNSNNVYKDMLPSVAQLTSPIHDNSNYICHI